MEYWLGILIYKTDVSFSAFLAARNANLINYFAPFMARNAKNISLFFSCIGLKNITMLVFILC